MRSYFVLAFAFSWVFWSVPALGYRDGVGLAFFVLGGFGPLVAAATMTHILGDSVRSWFSGLFHWRVALRWYLFAIGVPIALAVLVTAEFALFGNALDWSLLDNRLIAFLPSLLLTALFFGGNEEPGWRGFALPRLQDRFSPVRSTLVLGLLWAPWHLPILFATDDASHGLGTGGVVVLAALTLLSIVGYAFAYTYLINKTGSVLLCILLHACFNVAMASAALRAEQALQRWEYILVLGLSAVTIWAAVGLLIKLTGGRLGRDDAPSHPEANRPARRAEPELAHA
ncbi:MAG: CPBP family intramembrane glutamic endopeptidase [Solirubrobacteraceae bacterium]